jgi:hypothetical protein
LSKKPSWLNLLFGIASFAGGESEEVTGSEHSDGLPVCSTCCSRGTASCFQWESMTIKEQTTGCWSVAVVVQERRRVDCEAGGLIPFGQQRVGGIRFSL